MKELFIKKDENTIEVIKAMDRSYTAACWDDEEESRKRLNLQKGKGIDHGSNYPWKNHVEKEIVDDIDVLTIKKQDNYDKIHFYIHGGAYVYGIYDWQMSYVDDITSQTGVKTVLPLYKLAPDYTYKDSFDTLYKIYLKLLKENKEIIISGDSAGGGLATAFMHYLVDKDTKLPEKMILHSPWVNVTTLNKYINYYKDTEVMLPSAFLRMCGEAWAFDKATNDYLISPLYGKFNKMPKTLLFTSTFESFYPDIYDLARKMNSEGTDLTFVTIEGGFHVISVMDDLKEGHEARKIAIEFINS